MAVTHVRLTCTSFYSNLCWGMFGGSRTIGGKGYLAAAGYWGSEIFGGSRIFGGAGFNTWVRLGGGSGGERITEESATLVHRTFLPTLPDYFHCNLRLDLNCYLSPVTGSDLCFVKSGILCSTSWHRDSCLHRATGCSSTTTT